MEEYAGQQFVGIDLHRRRIGDRADDGRRVRCWRRSGSSTTSIGWRR